MFGSVPLLPAMSTNLKTITLSNIMTVLTNDRGCLLGRLRQAQTSQRQYWKASNTYSQTTSWWWFQYNYRVNHNTYIYTMCVWHALCFDLSDINRLYVSHALCFDLTHTHVWINCMWAIICALIWLMHMYEYIVCEP